MIKDGRVVFGPIAMCAASTHTFKESCIDLSPDEYSVRDEELKIAKDTYWDRYNDTDKFEVIKI